MEEEQVRQRDMTVLMVKVDQGRSLDFSAKDHLSRRRQGESGHRRYRLSYFQRSHPPALGMHAVVEQSHCREWTHVNGVSRRT